MTEKNSRQRIKDDFMNKGMEIERERAARRLEKLGLSGTVSTDPVTKSVTTRPDVDANGDPIKQG